jgi:hypothetical protein
MLDLGDIHYLSLLNQNVSCANLALTIIEDFSILLDLRISK